MRIESIYCFDYTKEIGIYDSIRNFGLEEMTYIGMALSTANVRVASSPTKYKIDQDGTDKIRKYVISRLEQLKEVSKNLAENSPKYILIYYFDNTERYFEFDADFYKLFSIAQDYKPQEKEEYESPYAIQKSEKLPYVKVPQEFVQTGNSTGNVQYKSSTTKHKETSPWGIAILIGIIFIIFIAFAINGMSADVGTKLTPVTEPQSGTILYGSAGYSTSKITVNATSGSSCVVKLKNNRGIERMSFYVRAGDTVTVDVPADYLYVYFASGETWYGKEYLFGEKTNYQKDKDIQNLTKYTIEYTLYPVINGNFKLSTIDADEF